MFANPNGHLAGEINQAAWTGAARAARRLPAEGSPGSLDAYRAAARQSRTVRHAPQSAELHRSGGGRLGELGALEPGSAAFSQRYLVGTMAPEAVIEQYGPQGAEGFGIVRRVSGVTGESI